MTLVGILKIYDSVVLIHTNTIGKKSVLIIPDFIHLVNCLNEINLGIIKIMDQMVYFETFNFFGLQVVSTFKMYFN